MVLVLSIVVAIALGIGAAWVLSSPRQQPDRAAEACWRGFAELMDYDYDPGGMLQGPQIIGDAGELSVSCGTFTSRVKVEVTVHSNCHLWRLDTR